MGPASKPVRTAGRGVEHSEERSGFRRRAPGPAALGRDAARSLERADRQHLADEMIARDDPGGTGDYIFSDPR